MKENTMHALAESIRGSQRMKSLILSGMWARERRVIRFNLVYLTFEHLSQTAILEYFVDDEEYPQVAITYSELADVLNGLCQG